MKASAGTAIKARGAAAALRQEVPRRSATPAPAKAAQASGSVKKASAPPVKPAKSPEAKVAAKPAATKPASSKPEHKQATTEVAVNATPTPAPAHPAADPAPVAAAPSAPPADRRPVMPDRLPPRPPAKAEIFVEGDHVVYPTHGVGKVERIATEE